MGYCEPCPNSMYSFKCPSHLLVSCCEGGKGLIQCTQAQLMKFLKLAPTNKHRSTTEECKGSTSREGVTPRTKAPLSSPHSTPQPPRPQISLTALLFLKPQGRGHIGNSLCCFTPLLWLWTLNLTENRNFYCVSVCICEGWDNSGHGLLWRCDVDWPLRGGKQ